MNENDSELTTICSQLKMQLGGTNCPPLGFEFDTEGEPQKMRKRDAELEITSGQIVPM